MPPPPVGAPTPPGPLPSQPGRDQRQTRPRQQAAELRAARESTVRGAACGGTGPAEGQLGPGVTSAVTGLSARTAQGAGKVGSGDATRGPHRAWHLDHSVGTAPGPGHGATKHARTPPRPTHCVPAAGAQPRVPVEGAQPAGQQVLQRQHLAQQQLPHGRLLAAGRADALGGQAPHVDLVLQLWGTRGRGWGLPPPRVGRRPVPSPSPRTGAPPMAHSEPGPNRSGGFPAQGTKPTSENHHGRDAGRRRLSGRRVNSWADTQSWHPAPDPASPCASVAALTHDLAGLLVVQLLVPVQEPEQRHAEQQHEADAHEHVRREAREVQALGAGGGTGEACAGAAGLAGSNGRVPRPGTRPLLACLPRHLRSTRRCAVGHLCNASDNPEVRSRMQLSS